MENDKEELVESSSEWQSGVQDALTHEFPASTIVPAFDLSLEELCRRFPNLLHTYIIDRFLKRKWSAQDICQNLPQQF